MSKNFSGLYTALITAFYSDKSIDYPSLEKLINGQIKAGVDGLVILGTTGGSPILNDDESEEIIKFAVNVANGKIKVIVGTGTNQTKSSVEKSKRAEALGADAVMTVNPYYNKPIQEGLYQHFMHIADSINIPMILYNIKGRTGVNLETKTLLKLAKHPNIVGVKEASGDMSQIMDVIKNVDKNFFILSGDDALTYPMMCLGAHGVVSVISNVLPKEMKHIVQESMAGNFDTARKYHYKLLNLMKALLSIANNPISVKTLMAYLGKIEEEFRLPICRMGEKERNELIKVYQEYING